MSKVSFEVFLLMKESINKITHSKVMIYYHKATKLNNYQQDNLYRKSETKVVT